MRIANIITTKNGFIDSIESFGVYEEQLSDDVTERVEECFREKIVTIAFGDHTSQKADDLRYEINNVWIEEGYYAFKDNSNVIVQLSWSDIN